MSDDIIALEVRNLYKSYRSFSLKNVSLSIPKGMVYGLIGRNGAGKTTLLKSIFNALSCDSGEVRLSGSIYTGQERDLKGKIGFLHESEAFFEDLSPFDLERIVKPFYPQWDKTGYLSVLDLFNIDYKEKIKKLSRGQKRLVSLGLILARLPALLILDEPLSGLDPLARELIIDLLRDMTARNEMTILFSSHITDCMENFIDYAGFLVEGNLVLSRPWIDLREEYRKMTGPLNLADQLEHGKLKCTQMGDLNFTALIPPDYLNAQHKGVFLEKPGLNDFLALAEEEYHVASTC
jgi:ABC-2 type transport system ATP-binding protein